jgi:hypothetical protein
MGIYMVWRGDFMASSRRHHVVDVMVTCACMDSSHVHLRTSASLGRSSVQSVHDYSTLPLCGMYNQDNTLTA